MKHVLQRIANGTRIRNQGQRAMTAAELTTLARELCGRRGWDDYYSATGTEAEDLLWARGTGPRRPRKKRKSVLAGHFGAPPDHHLQAPNIGDRTR